MGWRKMAAVVPARRCEQSRRERAPLGRINPTTDVTPVSITQVRRPDLYRLGAATNGRAPASAPFALRSLIGGLKVLRRKAGL